MVLGCSTLPTNGPTAEPIQQRATCPSHAPVHTLAACLARNFGEIPTAGGLLSNGNLAQILVNPTTGTWTAIEIRPDGAAQVSGTGTHWMSMEQADGTAA